MKECSSLSAKYFLVNTMVLLFLHLTCCSAQDTTSTLQDTSFLNEFDKKFKSDTRGTIDLKGRIEEGILLNEKRIALEIKQTDYLIASIEHRQRVFEWQHTASIVIFIVVLLIVMSGLILSFMHFYMGLKMYDPVYAEHFKDLSRTEIAVDFKGLKINSSLIGLMILVLSIAFLYLYLVYVFPISELSIDKNGTD